MGGSFPSAPKRSREKKGRLENKKLLFEELISKKNPKKGRPQIGDKPRNLFGVTGFQKMGKKSGGAHKWRGLLEVFEGKG